jgi:hypothetical protein
VEGDLKHIKISGGNEKTCGNAMQKNHQNAFSGNAKHATKILVTRISPEGLHQML